MSVPSICDSFLFADLDAHRAAEFRTSSFCRLAPGEKTVDLFCGAGGWTASRTLSDCGIRADYAVNHSPEAIAWHAKNNPQCVHHLGDAWKARPLEVTGRDTIGLLLASAACTTHSNARGAAPISKRIHMLGWCIARWLHDKLPRVVWIENVAEWMKWGPLVAERDTRGRLKRDHEGRVIRHPCKRRQGQHFKRFIAYARKLGYVVEYRVLDAADFGNASRRKRLFVQMRRDGQPLCWPEVTHGAIQSGATFDCVQGQQAAPHRAGGVQSARPRLGEVHLSGDIRGGGSCSPAPSNHRPGSGLAPFRSAADIIDWSDLGRSIFDGKRNAKSWGGTRLAKKTIARTCEGVGRFVIESARPFTLRVTHGEGRGWHVNDIASPLATQTTRQDLAVVTPIIAPQNGGVYGQRPDAPGPAITTKGHQSLGVPVLQAHRGNAAPRDVAEPLPTITAGNGPGRGAGAAHALSIGTPVLMNNTTGHTGGRVDEPAPTQTTGGQSAVITPLCMPAGGPEARAVPASDPLGAVLTRDHRAVVSPVCIAARNHAAGSSMADPIAAICSGTNHNGLCAPILTEYYGQGGARRPDAETLGCIPTVDRHALGGPVMLPPSTGPMAPEMRERAVKVGKLLQKFLGDRVTLNADGMALAFIEGVEYVIVDILFRMLKAIELAAAMGFPADYQFPATQRAAVKMIGNAVAVPMAEALILASLPGHRPSNRRAVA